MIRSNFLRRIKKIMYQKKKKQSVDVSKGLYALQSGASVAAPRAIEK